MPKEADVLHVHGMRYLDVVAILDNLAKIVDRLGECPGTANLIVRTRSVTVNADADSKA